MLWLNENRYQCVMAWKASAQLRSSADVTFCLSPNGEYWIVGRLGNAIVPYSFKPYKDRDLSIDVRNYIIDKGWADLPMDQVANHLKSDVDDAGREIAGFLDEMEVVLTQDLSGLLRENTRQAEVPTPKKDIKTLEVV